MEKPDTNANDQEWDDLTYGFVAKLNETGGHDWEKLSPMEQELAALWKLEMDMYNGGFVQFFCNGGHPCYLHAIRCLANIGAAACLDIVTKQYAIIERLENDPRLEALWDIPKYLTKEEIDALGQLDQLYWENKDDIIGKTLKTYKVRIH